jgi:hypothetical protein
MNGEQKGVLISVKSVLTAIYSLFLIYILPGLVFAIYVFFRDILVGGGDFSGFLGWIRLSFRTSNYFWLTIFDRIAGLVGSFTH